jgi:outer membrane protein OmpA-like peptidoglycan-associated protein
VRRLLILALLAFVLPPRARAGHVELGAGLAQPGLNATSQPWAVGTSFRLGYLHPLSSRWSFAASGTYQRFLNDTSSTSTIKFSFPNENADQRWELFVLDAGAQVSLGSGALVPYVRGTAGAAFWNVEYLNGDPVRVTAESGAPADFAAQEVTLRGALGVTYAVSKTVGLSLELEGLYLTGLGADFSQATDDARSRGIGALEFKVSYDLGGSSGDVQIATSKAPAPPAAPVAAPADADQDGVPDPVDRCPATPEAAVGWVDVEGCPLDTDQDGVPDYEDRCPGSEARWPVDSAGCVADADLDGVADAADACPATPAGLRVDTAGCPDYPALTDTVVLRFEYASGGTQLNAAAQARLRELVPHILYNASVKISICGYTDNIGAVESNLALSQKRAQVVKDFLVSEGVPASQLQAQGKGEANQVASNDTQEGRALNRRIELVPLKK